MGLVSFAIAGVGWFMLAHFGGVLSADAAFGLNWFGVCGGYLLVYLAGVVRGASA